MLNIFYGNMENAIYNTSTFFDNTYLDDWLKDPVSVRIIREIDKGNVISPQLIITKSLGPIPVTKLSGGTKTLLLLRNKPELVYNCSTCGDNCAKWILRIAGLHKGDLVINLHHMLDFGVGEFEAKVLNNGDIVHNMRELVLSAGNYI